MTRHLNLSPEMECCTDSKVAGGFYCDASEDIRDAIRRMQAEEERRASSRALVAASAVCEYQAAQSRIFLVKAFGEAMMAGNFF